MLLGDFRMERAEIMLWGEDSVDKYEGMSLSSLPSNQLCALYSLSKFAQLRGRLNFLKSIEIFASLPTSR